MSTFLMVLHVLVCLVLILVVLLQRGKGADMGAALGGGSSQTVFGSRGAGNFLTKLTTGAAIGFMLTSLSLSYLTTQETNVLVFDEEVAEPAPPETEASADALEEVEVETGGDAGSADDPVEIDPEKPAEKPAETPDGE
jgi:preprotein translocase subunit SecG